MNSCRFEWIQRALFLFVTVDSIYYILSNKVYASNSWRAFQKLCDKIRVPIIGHEIHFYFYSLFFCFLFAFYFIYTATCISRYFQFQINLTWNMKPNGKDIGLNVQEIPFRWIWLKICIYACILRCWTMFKFKWSSKRYLHSLTLFWVKMWS
jgi:hypothetical protein